MLSKEKSVILLRSLPFILMLLGISLIVFGFYSVTGCNPPYKRIGGACCIDSDDNGVCDEQECIPMLTYARNGTGFCTSFQSTCIPEGWVRVDECPKATCFDGIQNCHDGDCETDVDSGGPCVNESVATCYDGVKNGNETDVDCGGPCPPCIMVPARPTCYDGIQNQNETGVDCGGPCLPCLPSCFDGIQNQDEKSVDCGGPCLPCLGEAKPLWTYNVTEKINAVGVSSSGEYVVFGSDDDMVYLLNVNGTRVWYYKTRGAVTGVGISENGYNVVAGSRDSYVYLFRGATSPKTDSYTLRYRLGGEVKGVGMNVAGDYMVYGPEFRENATEDTSQADMIFAFNSLGGLHMGYPYGIKGNINKAVFTRARVDVASISNDRAYHNAEYIEMNWTHGVERLTDVAISSSGDFVVGGVTRVYLINKDNRIVSIYNTTRVYSVDISDWGSIVVGADSGAFMLGGNGKLMWFFNTIYPTTLVSISKSGEYAAIAPENRYLYVMDSSGKLRWKYFVGSRITSLKFSDSGEYLAIGTYSGTLMYFNASIRALP